jgi:hypothetical protein
MAVTVMDSARAPASHARLFMQDLLVPDLAGDFSCVSLFVSSQLCDESDRPSFFNGTKVVCDPRHICGVKRGESKAEFDENSFY